MKIITNLFACVLFIVLSIAFAVSGRTTVCKELNGAPSKEESCRQTNALNIKLQPAHMNETKLQQMASAICNASLSLLEKKHEETVKSLKSIQRAIDKALEKRDERCNPNPCNNGGKCISTTHDHACVCTRYYHGGRCSRIEHCTVGVKDGRVRDDEISASSHAGGEALLPQSGRLDAPHNQAWRAGDNPGVENEYIQIDLRFPTLVTGVVIQGRKARDTWITMFTVKYGNSTGPSEVFHSITEGGSEKIFEGNIDDDSHKINLFDSPIMARFFQIVIKDWHGLPTLKFDFLTC